MCWIADQKQLIQAFTAGLVLAALLSWRLMGKMYMLNHASDTYQNFLLLLLC